MYLVMEQKQHYIINFKQNPQLLSSFKKKNEFSNWTKTHEFWDQIFDHHYQEIKI